ncbi:hypothetical protein BN159_0105 [Streptomyces davaonensis JCM 4913]|uniref:Uncharacterized protein n=1 Tax=Streptomyces davaonensis (strain DSM 101723 / JCM 4913 / KCC S-0913 / 768) TaxID=1214101 RepID=K4QVT0_STRDJ|nr:hypothetical protein [Streptomyces davaonensis]CCK24484.1 hypothetical protein BN159_0105 [Streptomyces davaonensis JCM 4913]
MPAVLTTAAQLVCAHQGQLMVQASTSALTAGGSPVLVQADLLAATVSGCTNTNTAAGQKPCLKVTSIIAGRSSTLTVSGQPVMLETALGLTDAVPPQPVLWQVRSAGQKVLEAS